MSIADRALLVSLNVHKPQMTMKDKDESAKVASDNKASTRAVAVVKQLYPKHLVDPIIQVESAARRYIDHMTGSTAIRGLSFLPSAKFMEFAEGIGVYKVAFEQAVTVFLQNYVNVIAAAQTEQGALYDASVYPDVATLKRAFSFQICYMPVSQLSESRVLVGLSDEAHKDLAAEIEEQQKAHLDVALGEIRGRLKAAIGRIKTQCSDPKGRIYDSLTDNLAELLHILPALNLSDDQEFADACKEARALVVPPEMIRVSDDVRSETAAKADEILRKMAGWL